MFEISTRVTLYLGLKAVFGCINIWHRFVHVVDSLLYHDQYTRLFITGCKSS